MPTIAIDPTGQFSMVNVFTAVVGGVVGGGANYLVQRYFQGKCDVDWRDVANAAVWGALAGAVLPEAGGSIPGVMVIGGAAGAGQYLTSMAWSSEGFNGEALAWSTGTGAVGGAVGGKFGRAMGYPGGYYGTVGTALPELAARGRESATIAANAGLWNGFKNGVAGILGSVPNERASNPNACTCKR